MHSQPKSKLWMVFTLLIVMNMLLTACGGAVPATPAAANTAMPIPPTYTPIPLENATAAPTTPPEAVNTTAPSAEVNGTTVRDNLRGISQPAQGKVVDSAPDGLKILGSGGRINFDGASGPLEFADNGDVKGVFFRYEQIHKGKLAVTKVA